jgi:hypothetical protein
MQTVPGDVNGRMSRDGSEKELVTKTWQAECFSGIRDTEHRETKYRMEDSRESV